MTVGCRERIVVTGLGLICPIAQSPDEYRDALLAGRDGVTRVRRLETGWIRRVYAGEVAAFEPISLESRSDRAERSRCEELAFYATKQALSAAGLDRRSWDRESVGVSIGTCQGMVVAPSDSSIGSASDQRLGSPADSVAELFDLRGPRFAPSNACAAGAAAIAIACDQLVSGNAGIMVAGGADSLEFFSLAGFSALQSLDDQPCSPYGRSSGLTLGEGAAVLVLERAAEASDRGANVLAEVAGWGTSADAYHATAPDPTGRGAVLAMRRSLTKAGLSPDDIDYVNGHGTGTPANDSMERRAFRAVFGERAARIPFSSSKSQIGHTLGAAGALEAAACILAIGNDFIPPTIRLDSEHQDGDDLDFVPMRGRRGVVDTAMSNNYAFAGSNASILLSRPGADTPRPAPRRRAVVISGIGVVGRLGIGIDSWRDVLRDGRSAIGPILGFDISGMGVSLLGAEAPELRAKTFASSASWRRMDGLARLCVASARLSLQDAGLELSPSELEDTAVIFATGTGSADAIATFDRMARQSSKANPNLFPHAAFNAAGGHICTTMGLRGPNLSVTGGAVSSLQALDYAAGLISSGDSDVALVASGDELSKAVLEAVTRRNLELTSTEMRPFDVSADGTALGSGAITIVLESEDHARARGVDAYCELLGRSQVGAPLADDSESQGAETWLRALHLALDRSDVNADDVDCYAASAIGISRLDDRELGALAQLFGPKTRVTAPQGFTGHWYGTSPLVNVTAASLAIRDQFIPATPGLRQPRGDAGVGHVMDSSVEAEVDVALVGALSLEGSHGGVVLRRWRP